MEIDFIGKAKAVREGTLNEYSQRSYHLVKEYFDVDLDVESQYHVIRKYTYDRSYLYFSFSNEDTNYDVIYQRNGRGDNKNISTYLVESVGEKGLITKICFLEDENTEIVVGDIDNTPLALKIEGIINELQA